MNRIAVAVGLSLLMVAAAGAPAVGGTTDGGPPVSSVAPGSVAAVEATTSMDPAHGELLSQPRAPDDQASQVGETEPNDDFDTATTIRPGELLEGQLGPGDVDVYVFSGRAESRVSVTLDRVSDVGVVAVAVYGPDRQFLTGQFVGSGQPAEVTLTTADGGPHYVQVVDVESGVGSYTLTVGGVSPGPGPGPGPGTGPGPGDVNEPNDGPASATPLAVGDTKAGIVDSATDEDWFAWQRVGDTARIFVARESAGNGTLIVQARDPDGDLIEFTTDNGTVTTDYPLSPGENVTFTFRDLLPGTYNLIVASGSNGGTGPYTVTYENSSSGGSTSESGPAERKNTRVANDPSTSRKG